MKIRDNRAKKPTPELTSSLRAGRRALEGLAEVEILEDFFWHGGSEKWVLHVALSPGDIAENEYVPAITEWFLLIDHSYPLGKIKIKPASENGLIHTFPHQNTNLQSDEKSKWRTGGLCVDKPNSIFGRQGFTHEPPDPGGRLFWHVQRAMSWLEDASKGELLKIDDPFELPEYVQKSSLLEKLAFAESDHTFTIWEAMPDRVGTVEFYVFQGVYKNYITKTFFQIDNGIIQDRDWGNVAETKRKNATPLTGIWIKLNQLPVVPPWQAPATLGELREICIEQGLDLDELIGKIYSRPKIVASLSQIVLIGFPIPERYGHDLKRYHWQGVKLPDLTDNNRRGFTTRNQMASDYNRKQSLRNDLKLDWITSENWYPDQIRSRGTLPKVVASKKILLIGAGAIGSMIGEILVRGGVDWMTIVDFDLLKIGNLVRHTLNMDQLDQLKGSALASKLNKISPFAHIDHINEDFLSLSKEAIEKIKECDLIIDCSGKDDVLKTLSGFEFGEQAQYISLSINLGARRFYFYSSSGTRFDSGDFEKQTGPWLELDEVDGESIEIPSEGIGCWHSVFPARADDIWLFATIAVKRLPTALLADPPIPILDVFEQHISDTGDFLGVKKASLPMKDKVFEVAK